MILFPPPTLLLITETQNSEQEIEVQLSLGRSLEHSAWGRLPCAVIATQGLFLGLKGSDKGGSFEFSKEAYLERNQ